MNPLANNPLKTRDDLVQAVTDMVAPLDRYTSAGAAWVLPGVFGATYPHRPAGLEGFARRLWGLAPLAAGGAKFDGWERIREGLAAGTNPSHAEYWGDPWDMDIRLVEMASLGFGLALAKAQLWDPLPTAAKENVQRWLAFASNCKMVDNNWLFFTVLANLGLETVGRPFDARATTAAIERLDEMYLSDGWYTDSTTKLQRDYYIAFAFHFYSLVYLTRSKSIDPKVAARYRERAALFAQDFVYLFAAGGDALPFGRSLTYRFAQSCFWGALAYAGIEALPWGVIKGLLLRNFRWWANQPIFTEGGVLSIGYGYPLITMAEEYNAPGSPYWALKSTLPLALSAEHPFWQAEELPLPAMDAQRILPHAGMVICREPGGEQVLALATGQWSISGPFRHYEQKYSKFAYSTGFGFCIEAGQPWHDNMLCFSEDGKRWAGRTDSVEHRIEPTGELYSRWRPMPQVEVETWIRPRGGWHEREHVIRTGRRVETVEAGFATAAGDRELLAGRDTHVGDDFAIVHRSGIRDLNGGRRAEVSRVEPNTNILHPRTVCPLLRKTLEPDEHRFVTAICATTKQESFDRAWQQVLAR